MSDPKEVAEIEDELLALVKPRCRHGYDHKSELFRAASATLQSLSAGLERVTAERDSWRRVAERCETEAQQWKGEALAHKSSLHEAYQVLTGATGEPGNWNGAQPVREYVEAAEARISSLTEALEPFAATAEVDIGESETDEDIFQQASHNRAPKITVGDFRRAAKALPSPTKQGEET